MDDYNIFDHWDGDKETPKSKFEGLSNLLLGVSLSPSQRGRKKKTSVYQSKERQEV